MSACGQGFPCHHGSQRGATLEFDYHVISQIPRHHEVQGGCHLEALWSSVTTQSPAVGKFRKIHFSRKLRKILINQPKLQKIQKKKNLLESSRRDLSIHTKISTKKKVLRAPKKSIYVQFSSEKKNTFSFSENMKHKDNHKLL